VLGEKKDIDIGEKKILI